MTEDREKNMERDIGYISAKVESLQNQVDVQHGVVLGQVKDLHSYVAGHMDKEEKRFAGIHRWQYGLGAMIILQWTGMTGPEALKIFLKLIG